MSIKNAIKKGNATYEVKYAGVLIGEPASYQRMLFRKYDKTGKLIVERELFFRCNIGFVTPEFDDYRRTGNRGQTCLPVGLKVIDNSPLPARYQITLCFNGRVRGSRKPRPRLVQASVSSLHHEVIRRFWSYPNHARLEVKAKMLYDVKEV